MSEKSLSLILCWRKLDHMVLIGSLKLWTFALQTQIRNFFIIPKTPYWERACEIIYSPNDITPRAWMALGFANTQASSVFGLEDKSGNLMNDQTNASLSMSENKKWCHSKNWVSLSQKLIRGPHQSSLIVNNFPGTCMLCLPQSSKMHVKYLERLYSYIFKITTDYLILWHFYSPI